MFSDFFIFSFHLQHSKTCQEDIGMYNDRHHSYMNMYGYIDGKMQIGLSYRGAKMLHILELNSLRLWIEIIANDWKEKNSDSVLMNKSRTIYWENGHILSRTHQMHLNGIFRFLFNLIIFHLNKIIIVISRDNFFFSTNSIVLRQIINKCNFLERKCLICKKKKYRTENR